MIDIKKDFPILNKDNGLVYFDSTATSQKPKYVIDGIKEYLETNNSNIHRWAYSIAEESERLYIDSKKKMAEFLNAQSYREIIYTYNSTYASNLLIWSLKRSKTFKKWDKVLLSIVEHHANIVPWLILKEEIWIEIEYVKVNEDFSLNFDDFQEKLDDTVKAVSLTHVSNVTGEIFNLEKVWVLLNEMDNKPLFIVDASQSFPHFFVDVQKIWCDYMFLTGHKFLADNWIGILWWKETLLENLEPVFSWWWAIQSVAKGCFKPAWLPDKFEAWTPNLSGAISVLKALEYIEMIWWYKKMEEIEKDLVEYTLDWFLKIKNLELIGSKKAKSRVWVFSFIIKWIHSHDIADLLAEDNICIRAWQHCAEPLLNDLWLNHTCRMSLYIYNTFEDIDKFFISLKKTIKTLS